MDTGIRRRRYVSIARSGSRATGVQEKIRRLPGAGCPGRGSAVALATARVHGYRAVLGVGHG